ncbi:MAG: phosphatidate cytidylyltransferase [Planctomycetaceae bacterium]
MLAWRLAVSAVLIPLLFATFWLDHRLGHRAQVLFGVASLLSIAAAAELSAMLQGRAMRPAALCPAVLSGVVTAAAWWAVWFHGDPNFVAGWDALGPVALAFALAVFVLFVRRAILYREPGGNAETLASEILIVAYVGLMLAMTAQLRWVAGAQAGYLVLGSVVIATKMGDVGAYTVGRLFGKRKLIPRLSPGKTWAGAFGALGTAGLAAWAWLHWATPLFDSAWRPPAAGWAILYGVLLGLAGLVGDLCESLLKRDVGTKDSANLFPGFGGLLDLLDSILFAGPVAWLLWRVLPLATWQ